MTQKQKIGMIAGIAVVAILGIVVFRLYSHPRSGERMTQSEVPSGHGDSAAEQQPVPSDIDGITTEIRSESDADLSALDSEESAEKADIQADSDSVNNLGTAYDENSY